MPYIYETHLHTCQASACGVSPGADYISFYQDLGYDGIIVTDHFFNGNCSVPLPLPWSERVDLFCRGYEDALEEGAKHGFKVFFGWESCYKWDEYLVYGLDKDWLLAHPEVMNWNQKEQYDNIREAGGLVIQAHPFRERKYMWDINLNEPLCDGWEVANLGNPSWQDIPAYRYAREHGIYMSAGSDIHKVDQFGVGKAFGMEFDEPLNSIEDYVSAMKAHKGRIHVPEGRFGEDMDAPFGKDCLDQFTMPLFSIDEDGRKQPFQA